MIECYMIEKFLERANILKYGYGYTLDESFINGNYDKNKFQAFLYAICNVQFKDNMEFSLVKIEDKKIGNLLIGFKINLIGKFNNIEFPFKVEINSFKEIYSREIPYRLSIAQGEEIYLEKELAYKFTKILEGSLDAKYYYDVYKLWQFRKSEINKDLFYELIMCDIDMNILNNIKDSKELKSNFDNIIKPDYINFYNIVFVIEDILELFQNMEV